MKVKNSDITKKSPVLYLDKLITVRYSVALISDRCESENMHIYNALLKEMNIHSKIIDLPVIDLFFHQGYYID